MSTTKPKSTRRRPTPIPPEARFWPKVDKRGPDECWEWQASRYSDGYGSFYFRGKVTAAHRASYELFNGPIPEGLWVLHTCDNRPCVNPAHLWLGTCTDNQRDCINKGRGNKPHDERSPRTKVSSGGVRDIRRRAAAGEPPLALAKEYGIKHPAVYRIINRKSRIHVTD